MDKIGDQYLTRFRVYDTQTARWISRDPIAEAGGINLYGYVGGDPVSFTDPTGEFAILLPALSAIGEALATLGGYLVGGTAIVAIVSTPGDSSQAESQATPR